MVLIKTGVLNDVAGGGVIASQTFFTINGKPVLRGTGGDTVLPHGSGPHGSANMSSATLKPFFTCNGQKVVVDGDLATCLHTISATGFVEVL